MLGLKDIQGLKDIAGTAVNAAAAKAGRAAALWGACAVCAVAAVIVATSASILALEPLVGVVYARLIVAGVFVAIVLLLVLYSRLSGRPAPTRPAVAVDARVEATARGGQFSQIAMIIEAVMLGYSLSRRDRR